MAKHMKNANGNSDSQNDVANEVYDQYIAAKSDKESKGLHTDWATYDDYWRSEQNPKEDDDDPGSVTNIVNPLIENQVADLTDTPLAVKAKPFDYAGSSFQEQVERFLMWVLDWNKFAIKLERGERWRLKFGTTWIHDTFDPNENYPHGMIRINFENPAAVFPDPRVKAPHLIDDAEFVIIEIVKPLSWFKRNFPDKGEYVKPDTISGSGSTIFDDENANGSFNIGRDQARLIIRYSFDKSGYIRCVKMGGLESQTILYDSDDDKSLEIRGENGKVTGRKPWLKIKKYPLRPIPCYPREGQVWGMGDIELVKPIQDLINSLDDQIRLNAQQMAWLIWFIDATAGVNVNKLNTRQAGTVVPVRGNPSQKVYALQPKEMPAYITQRRETAKGEAERVLARPEVNQGFRPEGVNTFGGLALLQQQGAKKSDHKRRMMLEYLSDALEIALQMGMQLFTEQVDIPYEGADGTTQFNPFRGSDLGAIPRYFHDKGTGEWKPLLENGNPMTQEGRWRIQLSLGQGLPKDSAFQYQAVMSIMQSPAAERLLTMLGPEDQYRVGKHLWSMVGVAISDTPPAAPQVPQGAIPGVQGFAQQMAPQAAQMGQQAAQMPTPAPQPGQGIPQELQSVLGQGYSPDQIQQAFQSLPPEIQQALASQLGGGQ